MRRTEGISLHSKFRMKFSIQKAQFVSGEGNHGRRDHEITSKIGETVGGGRRYFDGCLPTLSI